MPRSSTPDAASRGHYLDEACAGDSELRAELERLLRAHTDAASEFLEESSRLDLPRLRVHRAAEQAGERIGHYTLREQLGEGRFGTVWLAKQEKPVRRRVALKIIKLGMDTREVIARFEQERQALAMMEHPNIARVLDAGATAMGRPFFVMELVSGTKITDFCDAHRLPRRERLVLFCQVCEPLSPRPLRYFSRWSLERS